MPHELNVYALPKYADPAELAGETVVVIDVLRASTTIIHALAAGATEVIPCLEIDDARAVTAGLPEGNAILGGERNGRPIDGFDLGNSPAEYLPEEVEGKTVVYTTTNGTRAMLHAREAERVLIAAFVNVGAVVSQLIEYERIHLLCAGTRGEFSRDDVLLAGMLVERLLGQGQPTYRQNAQAITAREAWRHAFALPQALGAEPLKPQRLAKQLRDSAGGEDLVALGLEEDILAAAHIDRFHCVPKLDTQTLHIRL